jgi:hypothetical protein
MKKIIFTLALIILANVIFAQSPQAISYQAVARDANGKALANANVSLRISILSGSVTGSAVYTETHKITTNAYGLVLLKIGMGTPGLGNFSTIDWGSTSFFSKIEMDIAGNENYSEIGTSQMLSVPYALYAQKAGSTNLTAGSGISISGSTISNTNPDKEITITGGENISVTGTYPSFKLSGKSNAIPKLSSSEILKLTPVESQMVYNTTEHVSMIYNGTNWRKMADNCWPMPDAKITSPVQVVLSKTSAALDAVAPDNAQGKWIDVSSIGGSTIDRPSDPLTSISGEAGKSYIFKWLVSNSCGADSAFVKVFFVKGVSIVDSTNLKLLTANSVELIGYLKQNNGGNNKYGFCWNEKGTPTIADTVFYATNGIGTSGSYFSAAIDAARFQNKKGYLRSFVVNEAGVSYGNEITIGPGVVTKSISYSGGVNLACIGEVAFTSGQNVSRGICWATHRNPSLRDSSISAGTGKGEFICNIKNLRISTRYYIRTFASSGATTTYGNEIEFEPHNLCLIGDALDGWDKDIPMNYDNSTGLWTLTTSFVAGSFKFRDMGSWFENFGSDFNDGKLGKGSGTHDYNAITIPKAAIYTVTMDPVALKYTISTTTKVDPFTSIDPLITTSESTATVTGLVGFDWSFPVLAKGVCWSTNKQPTIADNTTNEGVGIGFFATTLTGLKINTLYYIRPYVTTSNGTVYGNEESVAAINEIVISTVSVSEQSNTLYASVSITRNGGSPLTAVGFCVNKTGNPTIADSFVVIGKSLGNFYGKIKNIEYSTTYYVRSFATNANGTVYGNELSLQTVTLYTDKLYVVGGFVGWRVSESPYLTKTGTEGVFEGDIDMPTADIFQFVEGPSWTYPIFRGGATPGTLSNSDNGLPIPAPPAPGKYHFVVDLNNMTYTYKLVGN